MKKKVFFGLILLTLVALPLFAAYAKKPAAPAGILVGNPVSLTGMFAGFGQGQVFGMKAVVDDINKQGGVYVKEYGKKLPIKLVIVNSESDPLKAGTPAESLIVSDKVYFFTQEPLAFGQCHKTDKPWVWELPVVFSQHDFIKATAKPIFPISYKK